MRIKGQFTIECAIDKGYVARIGKVPKKISSGSVLFPTKDYITKVNTLCIWHIGQSLIQPSYHSLARSVCLPLNMKGFISSGIQRVREVDTIENSVDFLFISHQILRTGKRQSIGRIVQLRGIPKRLDSTLIATVCAAKPHPVQKNIDKEVQ
jgi:hypothetical protein